MKIGNVKRMVLPAAGIGIGMLAAPKVTAAHPTLSKYPWLVPLILLFVAVILMRYRAARGAALGLGAIAFVFLFQGIYNQVTGMTAAAQPAVPDMSTEEGLITWYESLG